MNTAKREIAISLLFCLLLAAAFALFMMVGCRADRARVKTPAAPTGDPYAPIRYDRWEDWRVFRTDSGISLKYRVREGQAWCSEITLENVANLYDGPDSRSFSYFDTTTKSDVQAVIVHRVDGWKRPRCPKPVPKPYVELKPPVPRVRCRECGRFLDGYHKKRLNCK